MAGILQRAAEMTIFCNPLTNSFQRLGEFEAPKYITWSHQNSAPLITVPLATGGKPNRFKLRAFDGCINPYIVFALLIHAGLDGIEQDCSLPPACDENLFTSPPRRGTRPLQAARALCARPSASRRGQRLYRQVPARKDAHSLFRRQAGRTRPHRACRRPHRCRTLLYFERY